MWRLVFATALLLLTGGATCRAAAPEHNGTELAKRSPASAYAQPSYQEQAAPAEIPAEYLALLQRYLEAQQQQHQQQHQQQQQPQASQHRAQAAAPQELVRLQHHQSIPLEPEQYHVETSRPVNPPQQQRYYAAAPVQQQQQQQQHHQPTAELVEEEPQQLQYHRAVPVQYGYEDEQQVVREQQNPEAIVRAQAQAQSAALAFQKITQAAHQKHQHEALEQIRQANEKHRQASALEQIRQGEPEAVSEAGLKERLEQQQLQQPTAHQHQHQQHQQHQQQRDPEAVYKARLKAQATALVAEQRRAKEASEYKAHAEAILALQAQQRAHLRAQEEAHNFALNFEKNQQRAQAQAQAVANAQALALYRARQQALNKAQQEAKQAAKAQHEARKQDPDSVPVVQYLLPNKVALPSPEVYLPKAAEALREAAAQEKRLQLKKSHQQQQIKHLLFEELEPSLVRRPSKPEPEQQLTFLVDAAYYRKHQQQQQQQQQHQSPEHYPAQYHQHIDPEKLALLVPVEP